MISSKQVKAHHLMLWTMRCIKVTKVKNCDKMPFHIQCQTKNYQYGNCGIQEQHPTMFKEDTFSFTLIDDLVLSMPFEFIRNLKNGIWTNIERNWLKRLQKHLAQAENNSIKQVRFIRKIVTDNRIHNHENMKMTTKNTYSRYILQRVTIILLILHRYMTSLEMSYGSMEKQNACAILLLTE